MFDRGAWRPDYRVRISELKGLEHKERQKFLRKRLVNYLVNTIKENPVDLVKIAYWNIKRGMFGRLWNRDSKVKLFFFIYYDLISLLSIVGIIITWKKRKHYLLLYMGFMAYILTIIIIGGDHRFRLPFEFSFILLSSISISWILSSLKIKL